MARRYPGRAGREQRAAAAREKVEEAAGRIDQQVAALRDGESWRAFLHQASQFHDYSFNNVLLIAAQRPDATRVASYNTWQKLDRQVQRGEQGMRIIAPMRSMVPQTDRDGNTVTDDAGETVKVPQVRGWTTATVFDVSQTDGNPLAKPPAPASLHGDAPAGMWQALQDTATQLGYSVQVQPEGQAATDGVTRFADRTINVSGDLAPAEQATVLAHELGHVALHEPSVRTDAPADTANCRGDREVEAESVAMIVSEQWGIDTSDMSVPYIAGWLQDIPEDQRSTAVHRAGDQIVTGAHLLVTASRDDDLTGLLERMEKGRGRLGERQPEQAKHGQSGNDEEENRDSGVSLEPALLRDMNTLAHDYWQTQLDGSWVPDTLWARHGIDTSADDRVGYAPDEWRGVVNTLRETGYTDGQILASGLGKQTAGGDRMIDTFRDRAMVTIADATGPIGFVGRRNPDRDADPKAGPKYLNTKETVLYQKKATLLGVEGDQLRPDPADPDGLSGARAAVLVEGPMDALAVDHDLGPDYRGVATCGTAFSAEQGDTLTVASGGRPIIVATDGDRPGLRAADRIHAELAPRGLNTRWAVMPAGHDPGDVAGDTLGQHVGNAAPMTAGLAVRYLNDTPWRDPQGQPEWLQNYEKVAEIMRREPDPERQSNAARQAVMVSGWDAGDLAEAVAADDTPARPDHARGTQPQRLAAETGQATTTNHAADTGLGTPIQPTAQAVEADRIGRIGAPPPASRRDAATGSSPAQAAGLDGPNRATKERDHGRG